MSLLASLVLVAATLLGARRFGVRRVVLPACLPMLLSFSSAFHWASGVAPAPLIGWLAALQVERGRGYGQIIAVASLPGLVLGLLQAGGFLGYDGQREQVAAEVRRFLHGSGTEVQLGDAEVLKQLVEMVLVLLPGVAYLSILLIAVCGYRLAQAASQWTGTTLPPAVPLRRWRMWEELIWVPIGALALLLVGGESFRGLAVNAAVVMLLLYSAQGLGLARHLMWRLGAQRYLVVLVYALLAFTSSLSVVALALSGLADNWFDWRRIGHRRERESDQEIDK